MPICAMSRNEQRDSERWPVNWVGPTQEEAMVSECEPQLSADLAAECLRPDIRRGSPSAVLEELRR